MLAAVLGWVLPCQSTPSLLHKWPKGRFGLHAIVGKFKSEIIEVRLKFVIIVGLLTKDMTLDTRTFTYRVLTYKCYLYDKNTAQIMFSFFSELPCV